MTPYEKISLAVRREIAALERWGSRFYPAAVALTEDQKGEVLSAAAGNPYAVETKFSPEGDLLIWGLPVAIVSDSWKGPLVLVGVKP